MSEINVMGLEDVEIENTSIDDIDNESVNLIFVAIDGSGSMNQYTKTMQDSLKDFKDTLTDSKEVDEMLVARADFSGRGINVGGYKKVQQFDASYSTSGMTPLYDVIVEGTDKLLNYMEFLKQQGMRVKAVFAVFSDGENTDSRNPSAEARRKVEELNSKEITTAFISFGQDALVEAQNLKFKNVLTVGSSASELRKAFNCLSKSVIESSKSVMASTDNFFTM